MQDKKLKTEENALTLLAILMAMRIRRYNAVALLKSLFEASVKKARNGPSTQLIEATSCIDTSIVTSKAEELS